MIMKLRNFFVELLIVFMDRCLQFEDFKYIQEKNLRYTGYYSFITKKGEICIDNYYSRWYVYVCNKYQEVISRFKTYSKKQAIKKANKLYLLIK